MPRLEPTNDSYIREIVRDELSEVTPRFGIVQEVHPYMEDGDTTNYKVDVQLSETGETAGMMHTYVPVTSAMSGAARGLSSGDLVLVQYRRGDSDLPIVTDILYDDSDTENAPLVDTDDFRMQIGEDATIEIVTTDAGERKINIGKQTDDRDGIAAGLSINIDDGSFSIMNENEHGLFVDADGNSILKWESMAMPWGAAGDVNWETEPGPAGGGGGSGGGGSGGGSAGRSDGQVDLSYDYVQQVSASDGAAAFQSALNSVSQGEGVEVTGSGTHSWSETVEVPDGVGLNISTDVTFQIPSGHNLSTYQGANILTAVTNANRDSAQDVTIQGGTFDFSSVSDATDTAGVWIHNATNSQIRNTNVQSAGQPIVGSSSQRGFGVCMTACSECGIYDSEAHDSGYDDIGVRGSNQNCEVIGCGGTGGDSGTIQAAAWGGWDIGGTSGDNILFENCWGDRIYAHGTSNVVFRNCETGGRLQTIGVPESATFSDSQALQGEVLIYTLDDAQPQTTIQNMDFTGSSAIKIGSNGGEPIGNVDISDCSGDASTFLEFVSYSSQAGVDSVTVSGCTISGSTICAMESGADDVAELSFTGCEFDGFSTGITGSYGTVTVENCTFNSLSESEAIDVSATDVQTSGNTFN